MTASPADTPRQDPTPDESVLRVEADTLREIIPGFDRLEAMFNRGRESIQSGQRGYFTPDEDDYVRQCLLIYRNYRLSIWDIIWRHKDFWREPVSVDGLKGFIIAYAGALVLFGKSLKVIDVVENDPMLRAKMNEPDQKWGVEADFFEDVLRSYSSISNYLRMVGASIYFRRRRGMIRSMGLRDDADCGRLLPLIETERPQLRGKFWSIVQRRAKRDWRSAWRMLFRPVLVARYQPQAVVASIVAGTHVSPNHVQGLRDEHLTLLRDQLAPGDVLLAALMTRSPPRCCRAFGRMRRSTSAIGPIWSALGSQGCRKSRGSNGFSISIHRVSAMWLTRWRKVAGCTNSVIA